MKNSRLPELCFHKASGKHYVKIDGRRRYFPKAWSRQRCDQERLRLLAERRATAPAAGPASTGTPRPVLTVGELLDAYMRHCDAYYRHRDGTPTTEPRTIQLLLHPLLRLYAPTPAAAFGPVALAALRLAMVDGSWMTDAERQRAQRLGKGRGWSRGVVNQAARRVRAMYKWAKMLQLIPPEVYYALADMPGLAAGRSPARETPKVPPAPEADVAAARPHLLRQPRAMVDFQLLTGARPGEVVILKPEDLDRTGEALARLLGGAVKLEGVWAYIPHRHKSERHGHKRIIPVGPKAQAVLAPFLDRPTDAYCFSPREAMEEVRAGQMRAAGHARPNNKRAARPQKQPGNRYSVGTYNGAVARACARAGVPAFAVHQLRHNAASRLARDYGPEIARIILGHRKIETTRIYIQDDLAKAFAAARESG